MEKISVLLPVFNAAPWLEACLLSILAQSEENWELLAVNDFSTDNSVDILRAFAQKDSRIQVFQNENKGIIHALRLAFAKSNGTFITRMDADDLMTPNKLEVLKKTLTEAGKGHVSTGLVQYFSDETLGEGYQKYAKWLNELALGMTPYEGIYKECVIPSSCWMLHKTDLIRCGAFAPDRYPEDYDLCFRFYKNKLQPVSTRRVIHHWRDHSTRSSRTMEAYADNRFFDIKLDYFLELDYYHSRPIVVWGAGRNGKKLAQKLRQRERNFLWVCNNEKKWGKEILDVKLSSYKTLPAIWQPQILISVASPDGKSEIQSFLDLHQYEENYHYFYFV